MKPVFKIIIYFFHNKFAMEVTGIAVGGITLAELAFADLALKCLIGIFTLLILILKARKDLKNDGISKENT